jgi:hypothetical protein
MNKLNAAPEKVKRKKKKPRIPKMPNKIVIIKNADKDSGNWMETWDKPKNRNPAHIPHPFRLLALGRPGRGKTNVLKNILLRHQGSAKKFKKLYIVCCDLDSREWSDCEPTEVMTELPEPEEMDGVDKTLLIIDDYEHERASAEEKRKLSTLMRYTSTHKNMSVMVGYQSFFDCPSICRKTANIFLIYKPVSKLELTTISNRVGVDKKKMKTIFKTICSGNHDCLTVDKTIGTPYPLRKNVFEILDDSDSDED